MNPSVISLFAQRNNILLEILNKNIGKRSFLFYFDIILSNNPDLIWHEKFPYLIFNLLNGLNEIPEIEENARIIKRKIDLIVNKKGMSNYKRNELVNLMMLYFILADYKTSFRMVDCLLKNINSLSLTYFLCPWGDDTKFNNNYIDFHIRKIRKTKTRRKLLKYKLFYLDLLYRYKGIEKEYVFLELFRKYPGIPMFKYLASLEYLIKGKINDAYRCMYDVVKVCKNDWYSLCKLGEIMICLNMFKEGISCFKKAELNFKKSLGSILGWKGEMYLLMGRYRKALSLLNKALTLNCDFAYCWRGATYYKLGQIENAVADLKKAISIATDKEAMLWYSEVMMIKGNIKEAMKYVNKVLSEMPEYGFAYLIRALLYCKMGDFKRATEDLNKVDEKIINVIYQKLGIDILKVPMNRMDKLIYKALALFKGNRRYENYFLSITTHRLDLNL